MHSTLILSNIQWGLFLCPQVITGTPFPVRRAAPLWGDKGSGCFVPGRQRHPGIPWCHRMEERWCGLDSAKRARVGEALWTRRSLTDLSFFFCFFFFFFPINSLQTLCGRLERLPEGLLNKTAWRMKRSAIIKTSAVQSLALSSQTLAFRFSSWRTTWGGQTDGQQAGWMYGEIRRDYMEWEHEQPSLIDRSLNWLIALHACTTWPGIDLTCRRRPARRQHETKGPANRWWLH